MSWHGEYKLPGGKLVVTDFETVNGKIANFQLSGDFFLEPDELREDIIGAVEGLPADSSLGEIAAAVRTAVPGSRGMIGITPQAVGTSIRRALTDASSWRDYEWQIVRHEPVRPALNAALDEVLTQQVGLANRKPTLRIWASNKPAVFIGSFQSLRNEVDLKAAQDNDIDVVRRISGGGAMYMVPEDSITFALYLPEEMVRGLSFEDSYAFLDEWVIEALQQLGIDARYEPLNDITGPHGKIGGAAQKRLGSGGVLHHVTIAYDMNQEKLVQVLRIGREKLSDKGTTSAQKRVDPLRSQTDLNREEIIEHLIAVFKQRHGGTDSDLTGQELLQAQRLVDEKFETKGWRTRVA